MYDEDDTSGSVTSNVLRIDAKSGDSYVTPGYVTFDQSVTTPNATRVIPKDLYEPEDASEFTYHKFLYSKNTDYVCLIVKPVDSHNVTEYTIYIKFKHAPTLLDYDFTFKVSESDKWQYCIHPSRMKGHTGLVYMAVSIHAFCK